MVARILISGFVQAVGFRQFIKDNAERFGLKGFVTNLADGQVEAVLVGSKEKIEEMIALCRKGPFLAEVKNIEVSWEETGENLVGFEIR